MSPFAIGVMFNIINIAVLVLIIFTAILFVKVLLKANKALDIYVRNSNNNRL